MAERVAAGLPEILAGILARNPEVQNERPKVSHSTADDVGVSSSPQPVDQRSARVKLRRGLTFLGMTLVLPGSAQIAAGNMRVGRSALRIWAGLWALLLASALVALLWRNGALALLTYGPTLRVVQGALVLLGFGWGALLVDAWRISRPELTRKHRLAFALISGAVVFLVVGALLASASIVSSQRDLMAAVFSGGGDTVSKHGRYNILLMGGDAGKGRVGLRPDSLTVASVDEATGRTVLFSLPRNLEDVPFPTSSPMHQRFPHGFGCADHSCMLNAVYTYATQHKDLYPGVKDPGARATEEAVEGATGLQINYYVLIDLKGFEALVDAVGGINLDIGRRLPIGGGPTHPIYGYVEAGKNVHLDGYHALWFARSRSSDSDYARIARQKCVMSAMLNQLDPVTVLTNFNKIASAGKQIMETNIPSSDLNTLMELAMKAKALPVANLAFVPPLIQPGAPKFAVVRSLVQRKVASSEAADARRAGVRSATPSAAGHASAGPAAKSKKHPRSTVSTKPAAGQETDNLASVCSAR